MKFDVENRWSGEVQFTAEIECAEDALPSLKLGLAVKWAYKTGANLKGAYLKGANLKGANLEGAYLEGAYLDPFKSDFFMVLLQGHKEVPGLINALRNGQVDGSTYSGECACLVGTIAKVRGVDVETLERNASRPAEQWFLPIRKGDKPDGETEGSFRAGKALEWALEYCGLTGIAVPETAPGDLA